MLKNLIYILLCLSFTYNSLEANSSWNQPKISQDQNKIGHIFKDSRGHLNKDTPENRAFIESSTANPENKVATNSHGADIYLKTMPDGTQAWAEVREGEIRNGGKNSFPKAWVSDSSNYKGGYFVTPKFTHHNPNDETFKSHLVINKIKAEYEALNQTPQLTTLNPRKMERIQLCVYWY